VRNALLSGNNAGTSDSMSRITFTSPEVAQVGHAARASRERIPSAELQVITFDISKVDRAVNEDDRLELLKIVACRSGHGPGACIVGEHAGESITEIAIVMRNNLKWQTWQLPSISIPPTRPVCRSSLQRWQWKPPFQESQAVLSRLYPQPGAKPHDVHL
jgi:pyruvate/2-oxoglutarate dehydrogenase complex dihydrolipoamide dehydrogenase (E3) component